MVQRRGGGARPTPRRAAHVTSAFAVFCLATLWCGAVTQAADGPIRLSEAAEQGTFNVGAARASVTREAGPRGGGDLLKLDFTIPPGAAAGLYAKSFPGPMDGEHVDIVRMALKAQGTEPVRQVAAALEIKGAAGIQRIPLPISLEGTPVEEALDWPAIGALREVVLSVSHTGEGGPATGTILIDGRFEQLSPVRKLGMLRWARAAGVLLASLLLAMLVGSLRSATRWRLQDGPALPVRPSWVQGLREDLVRGSGAVFMVLLALAIFRLGEQRPLDAGWTALEIAVAGMVLAGWWNYGLTGRSPTAREAFQDALVTGLLAVSASPMAILQPPGSWSELLLLSQTVAAVTALIYHSANAHQITSTGKHLTAKAAAMIAGTPYVFGSLVLLEPGVLLRLLGDGPAAGLVATNPAVVEFVGRVLILFGFNEIVAAGLGLASGGRPLGSPRAHLAMLAVAIAAVAGPWIAALGSGPAVGSWTVAQRWLPTVLTTMLSQAGLWAEAYLVTGMAMDAIHGRGPIA